MGKARHGIKARPIAFDWFGRNGSLYLCYDDENSSITRQNLQTDPKHDWFIPVHGKALVNGNELTTGTRLKSWEREREGQRIHQPGIHLLTMI
jgi:hypothetical protein